MTSCPIGTDVARAAEILRGGGLVAFATETVYGLGANALDTRAVARVFEVKGRPRFDPLIVHVPDVAAIDSLVAEFPSRARDLASRFWPGPLTLVRPKREVVPDLVTAGLSTVAIRVPDHPLALDLLRETAVPIAAPSANPFGHVSPTRAEHVAERLGDRIDYILDGGPCRVGVESTVLAVGTEGESESATLLRPGGVTREEIEAEIGPVRIAATDAAEGEAAASPGMLLRHYAPRTPLEIRDPGTTSLAFGDDACARVGVISLRAVSAPESFAAAEVLAHSGDLREAAANFFAALRRLDALGLDRIIAERFPDEGLGVALNDRLRRAAVRS